MQAVKDALVAHKAARHIALHLLAPGTKRYLPAHAAAMLWPVVSAAPAGDKSTAAAEAAASKSAKAADEEEKEDEDVDAEDAVCHDTTLAAHYISLQQCCPPACCGCMGLAVPILCLINAMRLCQDRHARLKGRPVALIAYAGWGLA